MFFFMCVCLLLKVMDHVASNIGHVDLAFVLVYSAGEVHDI